MEKNNTRRVEEKKEGEEQREMKSIDVIFFYLWVLCILDVSGSNEPIVSPQKLYNYIYIIFGFRSLVC